MWPVQYDLFVCDSADHKVESGPSFFLPRKQFLFGFNSLQMMEYHNSSCIIPQATNLKMFWRLNAFNSASCCLSQGNPLCLHTKLIASLTGW